MHYSVLVSVIVPNYNHEKFLKKRIDSILNQSFQDFEIIILDDCSTDNSWKVIRQYENNPKVSQVIWNKKNSGSTFLQWERGIELAKGKYIWIAESDDWAEPTFLEKIVLLMEKDNSIVLGYSQSNIINEFDEFLFSYSKYLPDEIKKTWDQNFVISGKEFFSRYLIQMNTIPNASAVVIRKDKINFKLNSWKYVGDWFFWAKLLMQGKVAFCSEHLNYFRRHPTVVTNMRSEEFKKEYKKLLLRFLLFNTSFRTKFVIVKIFLE